MPQYPLAGRQPRGPFIPPTPPPQPITGETQQQIMRAEEVRALINRIPGTRATGFGEFVGFHIEANSMQELISRLNMLPSPLVIRIQKWITDGEPVRIT